jgi:hypothetical protein
MPPPTPKETWIATFVNTLVFGVRRGYGNKYARLIANNEWTRQKDIAPEEAARQWAERQSAPPDAGN